MIIQRRSLVLPSMKRLCALLFIILLACQDGPAAPDYGAATGNAASFGLWTPGANDDCTAAQHDAYSVVGPDHKRYPTWHPPIDPVSGCSFGHDHGRDPRRVRERAARRVRPADDAPRRSFRTQDRMAE